MVKNDKFDAKMIALNLANGTYKEVYVPEEEDVAVKEYIRMLGDFKTSLKKIKHNWGNCRRSTMCFKCISRKKIR
ncbi:transposase [Bacillus thuringiensis Sbt003]|uniref:Transposase n=1 Tax=Bacillus thuringiensis Sbt003 TaxID=1235825 RepID=A0A9X0F8L0_BACTU|nr:transposase [Bacillus thuringiensis Sbt003]